MGLKKEIKAKVEYILQTEQDEKVLSQLNEDLTVYERKLERSAWERTPEEEKQQIRKAFEEMKSTDNVVSHEEMKKHLKSWRERLSSEA